MIPRPFERNERVDIYIRRFEEDLDVTGDPEKPNGMHWSTHNRLLDQADELDEVGWTYYTSMRHDVIEAQVATTDLAAHHRKLIADYLALPDMRDIGQGMVASGGLSPLLGALC